MLINLSHQRLKKDLLSSGSVSFVSLMLHQNISGVVKDWLVLDELVLDVLVLDVLVLDVLVLDVLVLAGSSEKQAEHTIRNR